MARRKPKKRPQLTARQREQLKRLLAKTDYDEVRRLLMEAHLDACDGNRRDAAESIGVCEKTIYNWLRDLVEQDPEHPIDIEGRDGLLEKLIEQDQQHG